MKAIVLSAGLGTRLRPLTNDRPKVMVELLGKPVLAWQIERLRDCGIRDILINLHYFPQTITNYFGNGQKFGVRIKYEFEKELLGTAGAVKNFQPYLNETFLVIYGDIIHWLDLRQLIKYHRQKKAAATLIVGRTDRPKDSDLLKLDKTNKVISWYPKPHKIVPSANLTSEALYVMEPKVIDYIPEMPPPVDFGHDVMGILVKENLPIYGYFLSKGEYIEDMGTLERLKKVEREMARLIQKSKVKE